MMATIEDLHEVLLLEIFSHYVRSEGHEKFIRNIPRVCKSRYKLSTEAPLWRNVTADCKLLLNVSRRGLLYNTQSLVFHYDERFSEMNLSPLFKNIRDIKAIDLGGNTANCDLIKLVTEHFPHLERFALGITKICYAMKHEFDQFLTVCGPTLKHLPLWYWFSGGEGGQQLLSGIASKCLLLETLRFRSVHETTPFPIHELRSSCPRMRELSCSNCQLINAERKDSSLDSGFKELKKFTATLSDFSGEEVYFLLKDSIHLENLKLYSNNNLVFGNISEIPSDKVSSLKINLNGPNQNLEALGDAVFKWRCTLSVLHLRDWGCDVSSIFERFLHDNANPQLTSLNISKNIDLHLFQKLIQKCKNLDYLIFEYQIYFGHKEIKEALELLKKGENLTEQYDIE